jgi:hypothetical protein
VKNLIIGLFAAFSFSVLAEESSVIYPHVYNFGSAVQVSIHNYTDTYVSCSGPIYMNTKNGVHSQYLFEQVPARFNIYRNFYPRESGDRVLSVSHGIFCH